MKLFIKNYLFRLMELIFAKDIIQNFIVYLRLKGVGSYLINSVLYVLEVIFLLTIYVSVFLIVSFFNFDLLLPFFQAFNL